VGMRVRVFSHVGVNLACGWPSR